MSDDWVCDKCGHTTCNFPELLLHILDTHEPFFTVEASAAIVPVEATQEMEPMAEELIMPILPDIPDDILEDVMELTGTSRSHTFSSTYAPWANSPDLFRADFSFQPRTESAFLSDDDVAPHSQASGSTVSLDSLDHSLQGSTVDLSDTDEQDLQQLDDLFFDDDSGEVQLPMSPGRYLLSTNRALIQRRHSC